MIKNKQTRKTIAIFFLLFLLVYKINAQGPTSPEATAFEPVDAADMVNLVTGDFSYVLPLGEVPSPEGGYPIVLSYHAGVAMDQEASWVGLGWSLNPGAINRDINGYADDWNDAETSSILYDAGGVSTTYSIGESIGISDVLSVGRTFSYTENKTFGGETSYRFDVDYHANLGFKNSGFGISGSVGTSGVGAGVGYSVGNSNYSAGLGVSFRQSFVNGGSSFRIGAQFSILKRKALGISFSGASNLSFSIGSGNINLSGTANNNSNVSYNNTSIHASIPIIPAVYNVNFGYTRSRYWLFDNQYNKCFGSLFPKDYKEGKNSALNPVNVLSDYGESLYKFDKELQLKENNIAYITKDSYRVTGQGISGSISPKFHDVSTLLLKNTLTKTHFLGDSEISSRNLNDSSNDLFFSFDNSFSSYVKMKSGLWQAPNSSNLNSVIDIPVTGRELISSIDIDGQIKSGYNSQKGRKREGSFIEVFTNSEITSSNIIEVNSGGGFNRNILKGNKSLKDGIGAYRVTTVDGRTYHYSLPVYQKEKFSRNSELDKSDEIRFREEMSLTPYATHWLLTAITGPDYVDINNDGKLDKGDYGYWVEFDYGKWSDGFTWSSPSNEVISNTNKDRVTYFKTSKGKSYSWGVKELYYLDKIKTRTHTALFIKEERLDNTSTEVHFNNTNYINRQTSTATVVNGVTYLSGFESAKYNWNKYTAWHLRYAEGHYTYSANLSDQKSLRLKEIQIIKNKDLLTPISKSTSNKSNKNIGSIRVKQLNRYISAQNGLVGEETLFDINNNYYGENFNSILDAGDIDTENIAEKVIEFNYTSNQLAQKSPNSLDGKTALNSLKFKGKKGVEVLPPYKFTYNKSYMKYDYEKMDVWGYYKDHPDAWSLNKIETPIGTDIKIAYESDDYDEEITGKYETFERNLQFILNEHNGKLRIKVYNEKDSPSIIDFTKKFQLGNVNMNLWICRKHDYNNPFCSTRIGRVDIQNKYLNVISISSTELVLETDLSVTNDHNVGLGYLYGTTVGLKNHPGTIREDKKRGECAEPPGCVNVTPRLVLEYSIKGNKINEDKDAGGIRVKQLELTDGNKSFYTNYFYNAKNFDKKKTDANYKSSGVTSYTPSKNFKEVKYISELPAPSIMYNRVTVQNEDSKGQSEFETIYTFKTLNTKKLIDNGNFIIPDILEIKPSKNFTVAGVSNVNINSKPSKVDFSSVDLIKNFSLLGKLISKEIITNKGHVIQKIDNEYFSFSEIKQGIEEEASIYYKEIIGEEEPLYKLSSTSTINYSTPLKKITTTQGNFNSIEYFDKYDFLTGQVLENRTFKSDGLQVKTKIVPAYTKYSKMGSKVDVTTNKNMLTQKAANYSYIFKDNTWKVTGVGITTWNNNWDHWNNDGSKAVYTDFPSDGLGQQLAKEKHGVWRKHKNYIWKGALNEDGTLNYINNDFKWPIGAIQSNNWQKIGETTRYNQFSQPLEAKDINNNYVSTKNGDNYSKVIATANAVYDEMYYSGAEYLASKNNAYFDGGIKATGYQKVTNKKDAHTGMAIVEVVPGVKAFEVIVPARLERNNKLKQTFKISVWVKKGQENNLKINLESSEQSFNDAEDVEAGDWVLKQGYIDVRGATPTTISIESTNGVVQLDDFRLHPATSSMTSYVYNEWDEVSFITGTNGLSTCYVYDEAGRLKETKVEVVTNTDVLPNIDGGFVKISTNSYNYKKNQ